MSFVIEAHATQDAAGCVPIPRLTGPFETSEDALQYMERTYPILWGHWAVAYLASPKSGDSDA